MCARFHNFFSRGDPGKCLSHAFHSKRDIRTAWVLEKGADTGRRTDTARVVEVVEMEAHESGEGSHTGQRSFALRGSPVQRRSEGGVGCDQRWAEGRPANTIVVAAARGKPRTPERCHGVH